MSVFAPDTDLRLVKCPLTYGDGHQLDFATAAAQATYFSGLTGKAYTDFSYQRKDHIIRIPDLAENIYPYNYVMYRNKSSAKWFYAFITKIEFINQNCTHVHIRTDVFQTWMFDFSFKQCLVEREHTPTDNFAEHTLPENVTTGGVREINRSNALTYSLKNMVSTDFEANYRVLFVCSEAVTALGGASTVGQIRLGAVPTACYYYGVERLHVRDAVDALVTAGKIDTVLTVYCVPIGALNWVSVMTSPFNVWLALDHKYDITSLPMKTEYSHLSYFGTNIKNRKCLLYPYHFYRLSSGNGQSIDLKPQYFEATTIYIKSWFDGNCAPSIIAYPTQYETTGTGDNWGGATPLNNYVTYANFPDVPYTVDVYERYLAENKTTLEYRQIKFLFDTTMIPFGGLDASLAASDSSKTDIGSGVAKGLYGKAMELAEFEAGMRDLERRPDKVVGTPSGSVQMLSGNGGIWLSEMCIRPEYLRIVDDYFTMYGYKVMRVKTPQFTSRPNHNFLKTIDCDLTGEMPQDDEDELKAMFNAGLTVWHNPATFGNYSVNNAPT